MPLYRYYCERCGHEEVLLRTADERDELVVCPVCTYVMKRVPSSFVTEIRYETGISAVRMPGSDKVTYVKRHDNWTPPKEYLHKKGLDKIKVY